jgi:hypothetical protein
MRRLSRRGILAGLLAGLAAGRARALPPARIAAMGAGPQTPAPAASGVLQFRGRVGSGGNVDIAKPSGVAVGDVVFIVANSPSAASVTTSGGSTWSTDTFGSCRVWWKILNATDVANAWSFDAATGADVDAYIGNGATTVTAKGTASVSGSSLSFAGYTPDAATKGGVVYEQNSGGGTVTNPAGWTTATGVTVPNNNGSLGVGRSVYKTDYAGGAIAFSFSGTPSAGAMIAYEVV